MFPGAIPARLQLCCCLAAARVRTRSTGRWSSPLPALAERVPGIHIIHQTGEREYEQIQAEYLKVSIRAEVSPFITDMASAFACADLIVCRSGASTVAEIAAAGKAAIFVPLPTAADDHQRRNAETLAGRNAALMIRESELSSARFVETVSTLDHGQAATGSHWRGGTAPGACRCGSPHRPHGGTAGRGSGKRAGSSLNQSGFGLP